MSEHDIGDGAIHQFFGLSYAEYLAIPRTVLQSLPHEWQEQFVRLLRELDSRIDWRPKDGSYRVQLFETDGDAEDEDGYWVRPISDPLADYQRGRRRIPLKP